MSRTLLATAVAIAVLFVAVNSQNEECFDANGWTTLTRAGREYGDGMWGGTIAEE